MLKKQTTPIILYICSSYVQIYTDNFTVSHAFEFPKKAVLYHEIVDRQLLENALAAKLKAIHLIGEQDCIIVLSNELTSTKITREKYKEKTDQLAAEIRTILPVKKGCTSSIVVPIKANRYVSVANMTVTSCIAAYLETLGWNIQTITTPFVYGFTDETPSLTHEMMVTIHSSDYLKDAANFIGHEDKYLINTKRQGFFANPSVRLPKITVSQAKIAVLLVFILVVDGFVLNHFVIQPLLHPPKRIEPTPVALSPQPTSSTAATSPTMPASPNPAATKIPSGLSMEILNGSGISGQATQIKEAFEKEGFTDITIGNDTESDAAKTQIFIRTNVLEPTQTQIKSILKDILGDITLTIATPGATFDIQIITGNQ